MIPAVYLYLGDPPFTSITDAEYAAIPTGLPYFPSGMIVQDSSTDALSIIQNGVKSPVSAAVYQYLGEPPTTSIADADYTAIPTGLPYFPSGMIVQDGSTDAPSIVQNGVKSPVSAEVYLYLGDPPTTSVTDAQYTAIPTGLPYFPSGMIVQDSSTGALSIIQNGMKSLVSAAVYQYLGEPPTTSITDAEYTAIPTGLQFFPGGMIVQDSITGALSIIQNGVKRSVSEAVYVYLDSPQTVIVSDAVYQAIPTGLQYVADGMLVQDGSDTGAVSIIEGGLKRLVRPRSICTWASRKRPSLPMPTTRPFPPACHTSPTACWSRTAAGPSISSKAARSTSFPMTCPRTWPPFTATPTTPRPSSFPTLSSTPFPRGCSTSPAA